MNKAFEGYVFTGGGQVYGHMVAGTLTKEGEQRILLMRSTDFPTDLSAVTEFSAQHVDFDGVTFHEDERGVYIKDYRLS